MEHSFRPTAVPLIVNDPYFSIWSFSDRLTDDHTRHWTGQQNSMYGVLYIDGVPYRFMGLTEVRQRYFTEGAALEQASLKVTPTSVVYSFVHPLCRMTVTFLSPLLADRPQIMSCPVSYVFYEIEPLEKGHKFEVYIDFSAELCGDDAGQRLLCSEQPGHISVGAEVQKPLARCGDDLRIEWGYLHLVHPNAKLSNRRCRKNIFAKQIDKNAGNVDYTQPLSYDRLPLLSATSVKLQDVFVVAYDDIKAIEYFHQPIDAYYKTVYGDFETMLSALVEKTEEIRSLCAAFDRRLTESMLQVSRAYADIGALAYRQVIAAHKLVEVNGKLLFLSKENFSNGCLATLDVTYPSIPLFLHLNPELVRGMLRPLLAYAESEAWPYAYAPHDCGRYPFCNGQFYSTDAKGELVEKDQMPIEECGNAILCVAAAVHADGNRELLEDHGALLKSWADYLLENGYDPANQLCTDDFAGHLAHNCNLSLKAIVALGAYGKLTGDEAYTKAAKDMAARWTVDAKRRESKGWRLTFDREDTWSLKYNIVWDRLLGLNLFEERVFAEEIELYKEKMQRYGVPLDSRADQTKLDWLAWTTMMTQDQGYTAAVYDAIARMVCESKDRVPLTDWYDAVDGRQIGFQARSVLGGFYINLLA